MMPSMASTLFGFEETLQFQIIKKAVVDHEVVESSKTPVILFFEGHLQPLPERKLLVKPEGQRDWDWWILYTDLELKNDDVIKDSQGLIYRVMSTSNWGQGGYYEYQLIEGPGA